MSMEVIMSSKSQMSFTAGVAQDGEGGALEYRDSNNRASVHCSHTVTLTEESAPDVSSPSVSFERPGAQSWVEGSLREPTL